MAQAYVPPAEPQPRKPLEGPRAVQGIKRVVEADGDGRRKKTKSALLGAVTTGENGIGKFACPYFKRNPKKYRKWTSCPGPGWDEVHRVKTHLYRRHPLPIQCPRCWEIFKVDGQLQSHLQQDPPCAVQVNQTPQEGFTKDQEKRLRSRKKTNPDMTDEDKWRDIYTILFPDDDQSAVPSAYYSESDGEGSSRGLNGSGELEDYATFIRREMPTLVRRELETLFRDEFRDVEERIRPRVADIVLNLQPRLLGLYKQSQAPLSEYGPQQRRDTASSSDHSLTPLLSQSTDFGAGTGPDSTPDTGFGANCFVPGTGAQLGSYDAGLNTDWDTLFPGNQGHTQPPESDTGLGLNWDFEFDKLLNPTLFMPPPGEIQAGYTSQLPAAQG
ncbi:hypothetical protein C8A00DRAFT_39412 [Chaetomidium leptoderma]|uniref:C2H2-type domain-containing protein n=1 Tax=Chaetomidium leptoderma TaxID=669021 RepID=A0AAN6VVV4_9PEZI|nr:hypothetical protein C8A00DRAFT_39412 [Chaetomidium leptoderma]